MQGTVFSFFNMDARAETQVLVFVQQIYYWNYLPSLTTSSLTQSRLLATSTPAARVYNPEGHLSTLGSGFLVHTVNSWTLYLYPLVVAASGLTGKTECTRID